MTDVGRFTSVGADQHQSPGSLRGFCAWAGDESARLYLRPLIVPPDLTGAQLLTEGPLGFDRVELAVRSMTAPSVLYRAAVPVEEALEWGRAVGRADEIGHALSALAAPRTALAADASALPLIMGIVNVTPDSFSDAGDHLDRQVAIDAGRAMLDAGCDILDIGGESTRPGAAAVGLDQELDRVLPVVEALVAAGARVSIDTRNAAIMRAACRAGAAMVNDVTALRHDPDSLQAVVDADVPVVLMHMLGEPATMQDNPRYHHAPFDIIDFFQDRLTAAETGGLDRSRMLIDPGIGFGKTTAHNIEILRHTAFFHMLGAGLVIGLSRKRFLGSLSRGEPPKARVPGSLIAGFQAAGQGAHILRVHDVPETLQARALWRALYA